MPARDARGRFVSGGGSSGGSDLSVDVRSFLHGVESLGADIAQAGERALRVGVKAAEAHAKATTLFHDQSGETRGSIRGEVVSPALGYVRAGGAASLLQRGTGAHQIVARGNALRFVVAGQVVFRKSVQHPGTAPRPFMTEARDAGERAIAEALPMLVGEAVSRGR